jgi:hypothetical protein
MWGGGGSRITVSLIMGGALYFLIYTMFFL